jgi:hypothetical protein
MAQTINYWYQQIIAKVQADPVLGDPETGLNSTSAVADYVLWAYIVASVIWVLDNLFDLHRASVDADLANLKPHTLTWYRNLALAFQYGQALIPDSDQYANTGLTPDQIAAQLIITQSAVVENPDGSLRMKVVKLVDNDYAQLIDAEETAFTAYIADTKDAGVRITIDSLPPDDLTTAIDIFYDALVLNAAGVRIDGNGDTTVIDAINGYLKNLKFNGEFAKTLMEDAIQAVDGVVLVGILSAQARYGALPFTEIDEKYIPDGGYLRVIDGGFTINYRQYV